MGLVLALAMDTGWALAMGLALKVKKNVTKMVLAHSRSNAEKMYHKKQYLAKAAVAARLEL